MTATECAGGTTGTLNNTYDGNDLELNGNTCTGGGICGAIYIDKSTGTSITHSYFEGSSRQIVLGEPAATNYFGCAGCNVKDNYFTIGTATPYLIEAINTFALSIEGNSQIVSTENSSNCHTMRRLIRWMYRTGRKQHSGGTIRSLDGWRKPVLPGRDAGEPDGWRGFVCRRQRQLLPDFGVSKL